MPLQHFVSAFFAVVHAQCRQLEQILLQESYDFNVGFLCTDILLVLSMAKNTFRFSSGTALPDGR